MGTERRLNLLRAKNLSVSFGEGKTALRAVRDVSINVARGEVLGIVGESGSGKSTLGLALMGYRGSGASVLSGSVVFDGISLLDQPVAALRRMWGKRIAMIHQNPLATLTPTMTVGTQIAEVLRQHYDMTRRQARFRTIELLRSVNIPSAELLMNRYPHQLSGGQRQRISIAIALSLEPELLILDEPTTNLDVTTEAVILDLISDIQERTGSAMIYISHNLGVISQIATNVAVMYAGELVETIPAALLVSSSRHPYTRALLSCVPRQEITKRTSRLRSIPGDLSLSRNVKDGCIFRPRCIHATELCAISPSWTAIDGAHQVRCWHHAQIGTGNHDDVDVGTELTPGETKIAGVVELVKSYTSSRAKHIWSERTAQAGHGALAVNGASLTIPTSSIVGLVGESGSGKTTLLRCIAGLETPEHGHITFQAVPIPSKLSDRDHGLLASIQMIFQDPESTLNPAISVGESLIRHLMSLRKIDRSQARHTVAEALEGVQLDPSHGERAPLELSGGERQRVAIARAFLSDPQLVLCDEPLSALDVSVQSTIVQLLLDLQKKHGASYLFVSHDLSIVQYIADHIIVMYSGEILDSGPAVRFNSRPLHPYTEALFSSIPTVYSDTTQRPIRLSGQISEADKLTLGCVFAARCPRKIGAICDEERPNWQTVAGRSYRCHYSPETLAPLQLEPRQAYGP